MNVCHRNVKIFSISTVIRGNGSEYRDKKLNELPSLDNF